jgi:hypothetical protein
MRISRESKQVMHFRVRVELQGNETVRFKGKVEVEQALLSGLRRIRGL